MPSRPHAARATAYTEPAFDHEGQPVLVTVEGEVVVNAKGEPKQARRQRRHPASGELGWRIRTWDPRTRTQPESTFWGSRDDALREMDRVGAERAGGAPAPAHAASVTVSDWRDPFLADYAYKVKPGKGHAGIHRPYATWAKAKAVLDANLIPALGAHQKMRTVTHAMLVDSIGSLQRKDGTGPLAPSSKTTVASVARSFFRDAVTAGVLLSGNPAARLPTVWGEDGTGRSLLIPSIRDMETLAQAMDRSWPLPTWAADLYGPNGEGRGDGLRLIAYTGVRFEELAATPARAVHLTRHVLDVKPTASESGGRREYRESGGKTLAATRHIIILPQAIPVLRRLQAIRKRGADREPARDAARLARPTRAKRDKSGQPGNRRLPNRPIEQRWLLLFGGTQGGFQGYGHWRKKLAEAQLASGVDYDAHDCRHICASALIASGADTSVIRNQMGHVTDSTTERVYRHEFALDRSELAARLGLSWDQIKAAEAATALVREDPDW